MKIKTTTAAIDTQTVVVRVLRAKGNQFVIRPVKGREGVMRVLGQMVDATVTVNTDQGPKAIACEGFDVNLVLREDDAMQLAELEGNAWDLKVEAKVKLNAAEALIGTVLEGALWCEAVGEVECEPSPRNYASAEDVERAAEAARERRAAFLTGATTTTPVMN